MNLIDALRAIKILSKSQCEREAFWVRYSDYLLEQAQYQYNDVNMEQEYQILKNSLVTILDNCLRSGKIITQEYQITQDIEIEEKEEKESFTASGSPLIDKISSTLALINDLSLLREVNKGHWLELLAHRKVTLPQLITHYDQLPMILRAAQNKELLKLLVLVPIEELAHPNNRDEEAIEDLLPMMPYYLLPEGVSYSQLLHFSYKKLPPYFSNKYELVDLFKRFPASEFSRLKHEERRLNAIMDDPEPAIILLYLGVSVDDIVEYYDKLPPILRGTQFCWLKAEVPLSELAKESNKDIELIKPLLAYPTTTLAAFRAGFSYTDLLHYNPKFKKIILGGYGEVLSKFIECGHLSLDRLPFVSIARLEQKLSKIRNLDSIKPKTVEDEELDVEPVESRCSIS